MMVVIISVFIIIIIDVVIIIIVNVIIVIGAIDCVRLETFLGGVLSLSFHPCKFVQVTYLKKPFYILTFHISNEKQQIVDKDNVLVCDISWSG
jgi:hypothetical protein